MEVILTNKQFYKIMRFLKSIVRGCHMVIMKFSCNSHVVYDVFAVLFRQ
jgi:hypothetical protein